MTSPPAATHRDAFAELVRPHWSVMSTLANRLAPDNDGDDALQEALAAAWRKRAQFDPSRGTARNWLLAIVADQARKGYRRLRPALELLDEAGEETRPEVDVDLRSALARLTDRQRPAITLHYYLGLPVADIADVMSCSAGTVKSTLSDARARLRRELGEDY
ncbi:MAG TPA: sigma-70 family RNA polymerase sigma factor [Jatrophihabitans sp.]|uniref:RNA polymerase sigma factor n=1 Tax=Jatrophihabitans sp. TaxID=1932789 RepID=UPI002E0CF8F8|nr:sigma-70 family RNA polymerase sigma factor [Jatrophihabitans sp.]